MCEERWAAHPTIDQIEVSTNGRVLRGGKPVNLFKNDKGYFRVNVGGRSQSVHVLVLETYRGPRPAGFECDHINSVRDDNRASNLRWLPRYENRSKFGPDNHATKLTEAQVREIREDLRDGRSTVLLAREHGVSPKNIRLIRDGEIWKHVA